MPTKTIIPPSECTVTREEQLKDEQQRAQAHAKYVQESLFSLAPRLLGLIRQPIATGGSIRGTELNFVNGINRLKLKSPKAQAFLLGYPPRDGDLCLRINFVVNGSVEGTWRLRPGPRNGNPLTVEYVEAIPGTSSERITPLSTGRRLSLNGLTDRTFRDKAIDDHIVQVVQEWYRKH